MQRLANAYTSRASGCAIKSAHFFHKTDVDEFRRFHVDRQPEWHNAGRHAAAVKCTVKQPVILVFAAP